MLLDEFRPRVHRRPCIKKGARRLFEWKGIARVEGTPHLCLLEELIELTQLVLVQQSTCHKDECTMTLTQNMKTIGAVRNIIELSDHIGSLSSSSPAATAAMRAAKRDGA